jgi:hypothetical protein
VVVVSAPSPQAARTSARTINTAGIALFFTLPFLFRLFGRST